MSERTLRDLKRARVRLSREVVVARLEGRTRLEAMAGALPEQLAALVRAELEIDSSRPALTAALRASRERQLSEAAAAIAARIRAGIDDVQWPTRADGFDVVTTLDVAAAVYGFIASCVKPLEALVLLHAGRGRDARLVHRILSPRPFFDADAFTALAGLLNRVSTAEIAVRDAQRAHEAAARGEPLDERED